MSAASGSCPCLSGRTGPGPTLDDGAHPRRDAASLLTLDISLALKDADPLGDPVQFRFRASVRKRYEQLRDFPTGLIAIGDAVCSFNPVYGQGMTVAAMEALTLRQALRDGTIDQPQQYFKAIARTIGIAWDTAVGGDLAFPEVAGKRTTKVRRINAYLPRVFAAAGQDGELAKALVEVLDMRATAGAHAP